jgi:hypothetical protein
MLAGRDCGAGRPPHRTTRKELHISMFGRLRNRLVIGASTALLVTGIAAGAVGAASTVTDFGMNVSAGAKTCLPNAHAHVTVHSLGPVETLDLTATGLPKNTEFDFFIIQVPTAPFGVAWYQGDLESDSAGHASGHFVGRFNVETFAVATGVAPAPKVFNNQPFPDAAQNPAFNPIQMYHLGVWFNSPADAVKAGCAGTVTPFNGEHNAGIQVLNTVPWPNDHGPLRGITN